MKRSQSGKKRKTNRGCTFQGKYRATEEVISLVHSREKMGWPVSLLESKEGSKGSDEIRQKIKTLVIIMFRHYL